jgi:transcriptional repressor NrdR
MDDKVLESRQNRSGTTIRRRRECLSCGFRFTSYEQIEEVSLMVVKRNGSREPFDLKKIERGLMRAVEKRPIYRTQLDEVLQEIEDEAQMQGRTTHEIGSEKIGEMVLEKLFLLDRVAYVRFASVYRQFEDVEEFIHVIENIKPEKKARPGGES